MKPVVRTVLFGAGAAFALAAAQAGAAVTVTFTKPEAYVDMPFPTWEKEQIMKELRQHFDKLGKQLPADQDLKVDVLDIDLAGEIEPRSRGTHDIRVMRGRADWPTMQIRYSLESQGKVLRSGEDRINDMNYLQNGINKYSSNEPLRYEKRMLDTWFKTVLKP
ncbi:MAG: DUF3016 domain-containing protein [Usitatibacteraceae bacterium]